METTTDRPPRAWTILPNRATMATPKEADVVRLFLGRGDSTGDLSKFPSTTELFKQMLGFYGAKRRNTAMNVTVQLWRFAHDIRAGDYVVIAEDGDAATLAISIVKEGYEYSLQPSAFERHQLTVEWIKTGLDRSAVRSDLRANLGSLVSVRELVDNNAASRIAHLVQHGSDPGPDEQDTRAGLATMLGAAAEAADREPLEMEIRELLAHWGHRQRSDTVITEVKRDLLQSGLTTVPPFTEGELDRKVKLVAIGSEEPQAVTADEGPAEETEDLAESDSIALRIGNFPRPTKPISTGTSFEEARHIMVAKKFSQLAVVDEGGTYQGAVTAERIIRAHMTPGVPVLADVMDDQAPAVHRDDYLLPKLNLIFEHGFVFAHSRDRRSIDGILTAADLTRRFGAFMEPLTIIEEIENRLRRAVDDVLTLKEIRSNTRRKSADVHSAADLFMGDYKYILEKEKYWSRLAWGVSQSMFLDQLQAVTDVRNAIMHFSSDPLSDDQRDALQEFREVLSSVVPRR